MADFRAAFTDGVTLERWVDPPLLDGTRPSRTNASLQHPHRRRVAIVGTQITVRATVHAIGGSSPPDALLEGRLFLSWLAEFPGAGMPPVTSPPGQSSLVRFTPPRPGHYTLVMRRAQGGGVFLHVDAVPSEIVT